jgi:hypothetical protein
MRTNSIGRPIFNSAAINFESVSQKAWTFMAGGCFATCRFRHHCKWQVYLVFTTNPLQKSDSISADLSMTSACVSHTFLMC